MSSSSDPSLASRIRHRFPLLERLTYVNSCSQGALSDAVRDAYDEYLDGLDAQGAMWSSWIEKLEQVRSGVGQLLNASPTGVAVTASATAAIGAVASAIDFDGARNTVVTTDLDFPTVGQIWNAQAVRGAKVRVVETEAGRPLDFDRVAEMVDESTRVLSVPFVAYGTGTVVDLEPLVALAHERGAVVVVDAYQGVGAIPLDVHALGADFVVGGMLKYLLGSAGVGYLVARPDTTADLVPAATGWFAAANMHAMDGASYDPALDARRFEAGTPAVPSLYAAAAGLGLMLEVGVDATQKHVAELATHLRDGVVDLRGTVATPAEAQGPVVAVASADETAHTTALAAEGVAASSRSGNVRISLHCYNTHQDIERVLAALHATRRHLR